MRLSVVVPCFKEEQGLDRLRDALMVTLPEITDDYEVLLIDDGSPDDTLSAMRRIAQDDQRLRYVALSRNFGKEAAMLAGLSHATGDMVAIIDADLQHPPSLLPKMVEILSGGYDQVVARRTRTGDSKVRTLLSKLYYHAINRMMDVKLEDGVGDFRLLTRRAVQAILSLGEYNRFSKGLFSWIGFETATIDYENVERTDGDSKWTLRHLLNYGIDGVISFNNRPLRLAIYLGLLFTLLAFGYAAWVVIDAIVRGVSVPGYVTIVTSVLGIGGLQLLFLGIVGEYLGRIYYESKRRPHFLVKEASGLFEPPVAVELGPERGEHAIASYNGKNSDPNPVFGSRT